MKDGKSVKKVGAEEHLQGKVVLIYFSAHWCPPCRGFTPSLASFYDRMKAKSTVDAFEIVFASSDRDQASFDEYFAEMPFAAVPFSNEYIKQKLSSAFRVPGIPMLVVLDSGGKLMSKKGRELVSNDPEGSRFPWKPLSMEDELGNAFMRKGGKEVNKSQFAGKYIGLYFSAHWCPPCKQFTPKLVSFYNRRKEMGHDDFEIIFVSSDKDKTQFEDYFGEMPWLSLPFGDPRKDGLSNRFEIEGIPSLVILDPDLNIVTSSARNAVMQDPQGTKFPFYPEPIESLSNGAECFGYDINSKAALVILMENADDSDQDDAKDALIPFANKLCKEKANSPEGPELLFFYAFEPSNVSSRIRQLCKLPPAEKSGDEVTMLLLNIPDNGGFYISSEKDINSETIQSFLEKFKTGGLERKQLGE